jgi:hypothetical protein
MARLTLAGNPSSGSHDINVTIVPSANTSQDVVFTLPPSGGTIATIGDGSGGSSSAVTMGEYTTFKNSVESTLPNKLDKLDDSKSYKESTIVLLNSTDGDSIKTSAVEIQSRNGYDVVEIPLPTSKKLVMGLATDKSDGTAVIGVYGSTDTAYTTQTGLSFGTGTDAVLSWKGNEVLNASHINNTVAQKNHSHTIANISTLQTELNKRVVYKTTGTVRDRATSKPTYGLI